MEQNGNGQMAPQSSINWPLIHKAYADHKAKLGQSAHAPMPQPQAVSPMHAMITHAMTQAQTQPGEDHGSMIIRALSEHLKRSTPDVSSIHKQPSPQGGK